MSVMHVVRHGQASFFSDDYDNLSPLGVEQSRLLGEDWVRKGVVIDEVFAGSLQRQQQTAQCVGEIYRASGLHWPDMEILPGLDEYGGNDVMTPIREELIERDPEVRERHDEYIAAGDGPHEYRTYHRLLESLMYGYIDENYVSQVSETFLEFHRRVTDALNYIRNKEGSGRRVAVFTSGGPVSISVQSTLNAPIREVGSLIWRVNNASVTQLTFSPGRMVLDRFNVIEHVPDEAKRTYR